MPKIYESPDGGKTIKEREIRDSSAQQEYTHAKMKDKQKWVLTVEETKDADTDEIEYFVSFPNDLLEAANLKEGDLVEWIDQGNGSYKLKKVEDHTLATYNDMIAAGFTMTGDGFWIKDK